MELGQQRPPVALHCTLPLWSSHVLQFARGLMIALLLETWPFPDAAGQRVRLAGSLRYQWVVFKHPPLNPTLMNRILLHIVGTLIVVGAGAYLANEFGVDGRWIGVGAALIIGLGLMSAATGAKGSAKTNVVIDE